MNKKVKKKQKGFTLVELIVVIAILGILAAVLAPKIMGNVQDAADQKKITAAQTISSAITVWNSKETTKAAQDTTYTALTIPSTLAAGTVVDDTDWSSMTGFEYATETTPDSTGLIVEIIVDEFGNSSIDIK